MENQYTYYEYQQNQNGEQPGEENLHTPPKKPKKTTPKWMKTVGLAVVFGVVASFVFQAGNVLGEQVLGTLTGEKKTAKTTETVNEAPADQIFRQHGDIRCGGDYEKCNAVRCVHYQYECAAGAELLWRRAGTAK